MAVDPQDMVSGAADISGVQSPQHPHQAAANMARKANHTGSTIPKPQPSQREAPTPKDEGSSPEDPAVGGQSSSKGGPAGDVAGGMEPPPKPPDDKNQFAPIDWAQQQQQNAYMAYHAGRTSARALGAFLHGTGADELPSDAYGHVTAVWGAAVDPKAISASVHNIWEQNTAQAQVAKLIMSTSVDQGPLWGRPEAQVGDVAGAYSTVLPQTANPLNAVGLGEASAGYRIAALAGPSIAQATLDPNDHASALTWAAITAMVLGGRLPPGAREGLTKALGRWPEVEDALRGVLKAKKTADRNGVDPNYRPGRDLISETLRQGPLGEKQKDLAKAGTALPKVEAAVGNKGEIAIKQTTVAKQRAGLLKKLGVESVDDLVHKAAEGGITGKAAKLVAQNWKLLGLPYDLKGLTSGDLPLRDPRRALLAIHNAGDEQASADAQAHLASVHHYLDQIHRGPFSNDGDPLKSVWRALTGVARHDRLIDQAHSLSAARMLARSGVKGEQVTKAIEGDLAAYQAMPPEAQMVVDSFRLITNALRHESQGTDYAKNFVGNWLPHIDRLPSSGTRGARGATPYATETRKSRNLAIRTNEAGELIQTQQFKNVGEANAALNQTRQRTVDALTNPLAKLPKALTGDPESEAIRKMTVSDPEGALARAQEVAARLHPDKETDFLKILGSGVLTRQMKALHAHKALGMWETGLHADGKRIAVKVDSKDPQRHAEYLAQQGYVRPQTSFANGYMVHKELADLLDRSTSSGGGRPAALKAALDLESQAIARIMYFPPIHAMNVAGRMGVMWMSHPMAMTHYLLNGKALLPHQVDEASYLLRSEAYNAGVLPHSRNLNYAQQLQGAMGNALGDTMEDQAQTWTGKAMHAMGAGKPYDWANQGHATLNNYFWGAVNDFGVMAYHLEKDAAVKAGLSEEEAKLWAARRGNTWMGHVAPEDHNPLTHDLARSIAFAPNWWRTWAELVVPLYRRSGVNYGNPNLIRHIAESQAKTLFTMFAFQKLTGNAFNLLASGHLQNQNLPGNQDRIEATAPWTDKLPIVGQTPRSDPKTGGRRTMENPLGRFQRDLEEIAGLQSGHPDWKPQDAEDGTVKFLVSRLAPLVEGAGALFNFDPYHAFTTGFQNTKIDRSQPTGPSAMNLFYAALMMSPLGLSLPQQIASNQQKDASAPPVDGPFGTKIPKSVADSVGSLGGDLEKTLLTWATGINPPYEYAQRTRGQQPSDQQYQRYAEAKSTYQNQMASLSAQALGGQITPADWLGKYKQAHGTYASISESTFKNSPSYVNGDDGMMNDYLGLQQEATAPDGTVDYAKLDQLQAHFRQQHDPEGLHRMDMALSANDQRFPMLGLYHRTLDAYRKWQESWAAQHGEDVGTLRQQISEYGHLYGDQHASAAYLTGHRELALYENAKKREWETSPKGLMYGLFYSSSAVATYMRAHHLDAQQVEQQAMAS